MGRSFIGGVVWPLAGMVPRDLLHALLVLCDSENVGDSLLHQPLAAKLPGEVIFHSLVGHLVDIGVAGRIRLVLEPVHLHTDGLATPRQGQGDSAQKWAAMFETCNILDMPTHLSGKLSYSNLSQ